MAITDLTANDLEPADREIVGLGPMLNAALAPVASLKLTVALLAASIFIILAGTLAQVDKDIWQVVREYFHTWWARIEFRLFLPPSFWKAFTDAPLPQIPGSFWFPGGRLIGSTMALNLLAAHLIRFRVQARGWPLISGLLVTLAGIVLTALVVLSANNPEGLQTQAWVSYDVLWWVFLAGLAAACAASVYGWFQVPKEQTKTQWLVATAVLAQVALLGFLVVYSGRGGRLSDSAMRILWQLTQGGGVAVVLLVGCALVFRKRAGVVLLHGGIGLMMFGELLVSMTAIEGQLQMQEGETVNFVQDIRTVELAVVDRSGEKTDRVTVVPKSVLLSAAKSEQSIDDDRLPFEIHIDRFLQNSSLRKRGPMETDEKLGTKGHALAYVAEEVRPGSGVDSDSKVDVSAAYVSLVSKTSKQKLGSYLLGIVFSSDNSPEKVDVDGRTYEVALRFKRMYKPYKFQLMDVRKDDYVGTNTPRNYSSDVHLVDTSRNVDRELKIWMNNPLRFAGETFYQSGYHRDPTTQIEGTTLQVVTNTGWMIPYVACMIVALGMLAHFSITLMRFLQRAEISEVAAVSTVNPGSALPVATTPRMIGGKAVLPAKVKFINSPTATLERQTASGELLQWMIPGIFGALALLWAVSGAMSRPPKDGEFDLAAFGSLPVVADGRIKPLDTLARSSLLVISSGKQSFKDANDQEQPAIVWLLDVMARQDRAFGHCIFRVENDEVQRLVGLKRRERFRYAPEEFLGDLEKLTEQAELAHKKEAAQIATYDKKVLELEKKIGVFDLLLQSFAPPNIRMEQAKDDLMAAVGRQQALRRGHPPLVVPPTEKDGEWDTFAASWTKNFVKAKFLGQDADEPVKDMAAIMAAYHDGDKAEFNKEVHGYRAWLAKQAPPDLNLQKLEFETFFNRYQPFALAQRMYLTAFLFGALAWFGATSPTYWRVMTRSAVAFALVAFAVHCFALSARMYISGRPPVFNLYSAAVFIGWGCALLGLLMNLFYRNGMGTILASKLGYLTLGIADHLAADGDTFVVLQAVLDTQFWLATHVTCITLGYATTYVAGLLGLLYILLGLATPILSPSLGRDLNRMTYGALCFSIFFSFVGTVLGGLWADDSWGRFWGWDPKENGALMIVLWNALCLHARWGAMVKERGLAVLTILGNIVVSWSFFGVNELGIGLHAYGQTEGRLAALGIVCLAHLGVAGLGLIPERLWLSRFFAQSSQSPG